MLGDEKRDPVKSLKAKVTMGDDGWLIAEITGLRALTKTRDGVVTQGRDLDGLAFMVRDAFETLTGERDFAIQLILPADTRLPTRRRSPATPKKTRRRAA